MPRNRSEVEEPIVAPRIAEQCDACGRCLMETELDSDGTWWVEDGQALGCGCAGAWSADGDGGAYQSHDDEACIVCRDDGIEWLTKKRDELREDVKLWRSNAETLNRESINLRAERDAALDAVTIVTRQRDEARQNLRKAI